MMTTISVITFDGPSGSGKGTISRWLARALKWHYLESGALYRVLALAALKRGMAIDEEAPLSQAALSLDIEFNESTHDVYWAGQCVTAEIQTERCASVASQIAGLPSVRVALLNKQRSFCKGPGLVADGRDMGTVVFPAANLKFFIDASLEERAKRRYLQLKEAGQNVSLAELHAQLGARDVRDRTRANAPLKPAEGAVVIDTTAVGVEAVCARVKQVLQTSPMGLLIN